MPLTLEAEDRLTHFAEASGDFCLFGIAMNPVTGEMATFSSHQLPPGAVLGFLQQAVTQMITAAANQRIRRIQPRGGSKDGMAQGSTPQTEGGNIERYN